MSADNVANASQTDESNRYLEEAAAWAAVSAAFGALGRAFICADADFRIIHGLYVLDQVFGTGAAASLAERFLEDVFGEDLFGVAGSLRQALLAGERREGWRAQMRMAGREAGLVSLSAAPFPQHLKMACSQRVKYVVVLRPSEQDRDDVVGAPVTVGGLVARSPAMARIFALVDNLRQTEATVLITGESGTGKELLARLVHDQSPRRQGPFVAVNCGALPRELLEAEMFGHVRGAFTGAVRDRIGRCEAASDGTLFLDEVGDLPLALQVKLLRVLQDGSFERLGENQTRTSRARVVAATHIDLVKAVNEGRFREDLYYRLRVVPMEIPPLRRRREDIEPLAQVLLSRVGARHGRALRFSPDSLRVLLHHDWPGNVREMENALEYAVTVCKGQTIQPEDLPEWASARPGTQAIQAGTIQTHATVSAQPVAGEEARLRAALDAHRWRRDEAAAELGVSRVTLWRRMRHYGMLHDET